MQSEIIKFLLTTDFDSIKNKMIDRFFTINHYSKFPFNTDGAIESADVVFRNDNFFEIYRFKTNTVKTPELFKGELSDQNLVILNDLISQRNFEDATLLIFLTAL